MSKAELVELKYDDLTRLVQLCVYDSHNISIAINSSNNITVSNGSCKTIVKGIEQDTEYSKEDLTVILPRMILKHKEFEYQSYTYHTPQFDIWIKEYLNGKDNR